MAVTDERGVAVCSARRRGGVLFPALRRGPLTKACNLSLCSSVIVVIASCKEDGNLAILRTMARWSRALNHTLPPRQERCLQGEHSGPLSRASLTEGRQGGRGGGAGRGGEVKLVVAEASRLPLSRQSPRTVVFSLALPADR